MSRWKKRLSKKNMARVLAASLTVAPLVYALPPVVAPVGKVFAEGNHAPKSNFIKYKSFQKGDTRDYYLYNASNSTSNGEVFIDPDGDNLTVVESSILDSLVVSLSTTTTMINSVNVTVLQVTGLEAGTTTITVSVQDPEGLEATERFVVTVEDVSLNNNPPRFNNEEVSDDSMLKNSSKIIHLGDFFTDDYGLDPSSIIFTEDSDILDISMVSGSVYSYRLSAKKSGVATVKLSAQDNATNPLHATYYYNLTVENGELTGEDKSIYLEESESRIINLVDDPENPEDWGVFLDTDGDSLTISTPVLGTDGVVSAYINNDGLLSIYGENEGTTTITVSASDPDDNTADATITAYVLESRKVYTDTLTVNGETDDAFYLTEFFQDEDVPSLGELETRVHSGDASKIVIENGTTRDFNVSNLSANNRYMLYRVSSGTESAIPVEFIHIEKIPNEPHEMGKDLIVDGYGEYYLAPYSGYLWTKEQLKSEGSRSSVSTGRAGEMFPARINTEISDNENELEPGLYVLYNIHSEGSPVKAVQFVQLIDLTNHLHKVSQIDASNGGNGIDVKDIVLYLKNSGQLDLNVLKLLIQHIGPRFAIEEEGDLGD